MVEIKDPTRDELIRELRIFRKGAGHPSIVRLNGLHYLTEILGEGIKEKAFDEIGELYEAYGKDPETNIGAFFYLAGWNIGLESVDERRVSYRDRYYVDVSTAWRRSERGIQELTTIVRDLDEKFRPWAFIAIFQNRDTFQPFLHFNLGYETWSKPSVFIDDVEQEIDFHVHYDPDNELRYTRRIILPDQPLNLDVEFGEAMAVLRVVWNMPAWPIWSLGSWTADPRIMTRMRTFRNRAVEVSLEWFRQTPPGDVEGLVGDGAIWAERRDPNQMNLPPGWGI